MIIKICKNTTYNCHQISTGVCAPGCFSETGREPCSLCPPNTYSQYAGMTTCLECPHSVLTIPVNARGKEMTQCIGMLHLCAPHFNFTILFV